MIKKLQKTDCLFVTALALGLLIHLLFIREVPFSDDESFYALIPFRLINGESLIRNEWHLTQFSSLFAFIPVYIWTAIKGSADGIIIFLRCVYLLIHTTIAVVTYRFFRKYGNWAIMASMMFYVQIAYKIQAISYQSMFVIFLLLLSLCMLSIYKKVSVKAFIFAGVCFGCCCVCNPLLCFAFVLYLLACALWTKREIFTGLLMKIKNCCKTEKGKKLTKKQQKQQKQQKLDAFAELENYNCFFNKKAILWITCGILIVVVIAAAFFFLTGGTIDSIFKNAENLLGSTEYDIASKSIFEKFADTLHYFSQANLGMPWILPVLFIVLLLDKKRKLNSHRFVYLLVSLAWTVPFIFGVMKNIEIYLCAISLPFFITSTICYILTENKNKILFRCMYVPCLIAAFIHYLAADTHLAAIGVVFAISNVAGVLFAMDLFKEMRSVSKKEVGSTTNKRNFSLQRSVIIVSFCVQILFYGIFYQYGYVSRDEAVKATTGPFSGLYMTQSEYNRYDNLTNDMDYIKNLTRESDPILLASYSNWMYMYLDRPVATYSAWYRGSLNQEQLTDYYKRNPSKIPKYIYTTSSNFTVLHEMFEFTQEELSNGILLTVTRCKF